jgi:hypothetical protein
VQHGSAVLPLVDQFPDAPRRRLDCLDIGVAPMMRRAGVVDRNPSVQRIVADNWRKHLRARAARLDPVARRKSSSTASNCWLTAGTVAINPSPD